MNCQRRVIALWVALLAAASVPGAAFAHCDTMDGPVVKDARAALEKGDAVPVLKWVHKAQEEEVKAALKRAAAVRAKGPEARELADLYFFETVVRLHRQSEGEPYTGLKPAGTDPGPAVAAADRALETGSADALVKQTTEAVAAGIRLRLAEAMEKRKHAEHGAEAGRQFVKAYVEFVHYVERLHHAATSAAAHAAHGPAVHEAPAARPAHHQPEQPKHEH